MVEQLQEIEIGEWPSPLPCAHCNQQHAVVFGRQQINESIETTGVCADCWEILMPCVYCGFLFARSAGIDYWCSPECATADPEPMPEIFVASGLPLAEWE
jgi:hypothetical protein